ncbi:MAG TPA: hypothetical protein VKV73_17750 [Chloroflexota bacterium]|nr:hypothetical protein [Chloroflexota bacterium]
MRVAVRMRIRAVCVRLLAAIRLHVAMFILTRRVRFAVMPVASGVCVAVRMPMQNERTALRGGTTIVSRGDGSIADGHFCACFSGPAHPALSADSEGVPYVRYG